MAKHRYWVQLSSIHAAYINNDPVNWVDPWGLNAQDGQKSQRNDENKKEYLFRNEYNYIANTIKSIARHIEAFPDKTTHYSRNKNINFNASAISKTEDTIKRSIEKDAEYKKMTEFQDGYHEQGTSKTHDPSKNDKYISKDGHIELVFNEHGELVTDPVNLGTYNFVNPNADPIGHFIQDVVPYLLWGNTPDDPTGIIERLTAPVVGYGYKGSVDE